MVNAPRMHQEKRAIQVQQIMASIEKAMKMKKVDFESIVLATMASLNLSRRTARDYVNMALFNLGITL